MNNQLPNNNNQINSKSVIWNLIIGHCLSSKTWDFVIGYWVLFGAWDFVIGYCKERG
jgi:hypothetical protein